MEGATRALETGAATPPIERSSATHSMVKGRPWERPWPNEVSGGEHESRKR